MNTISVRKSSISLQEKSSGKVLSFADFLATLRVKAGPRGDLIALFRSMLNADAFPVINEWRDFYRLLMALHAQDATVNEARKLWREYTKAHPAASPGKPPEDNP